MSKVCIWCRKNEQVVTFHKKAHTIPQQLGGRMICENVCDGCNLFFGTHFNGSPSVETIIKETFNITRARLLSDNKIGKNKPLAKFSSIYFTVNFKKNMIDIKSKYLAHAGFQEKICRQMKKGIYKMYLEETERQHGEGLNSRYDFIREFCRYNLGDYPVIYFERAFGIIATANEWIEHPELLLDKDSQMKYLVQEDQFQEFEFLGHVIAIAKTRSWLLDFDNYITRTAKAKIGFFKGWKFVKKFNDIDLTLAILNS